MRSSETILKKTFCAAEMAFLLCHWAPPLCKNIHKQMNSSVNWGAVPTPITTHTFLPHPTKLVSENKWRTDNTTNNFRGWSFWIQPFFIFRLSVFSYNSPVLRIKAARSQASSATDLMKLWKTWKGNSLSTHSTTAQTESSHQSIWKHSVISCINPAGNDTAHRICSAIHAQSQKSEQ